MRLARARQHSGFTLLELMVALAIVGVLASIAIPMYQRYTFRVKAAEVVVQSEPVMRLIQEFQGAVDKNQYVLQLVNSQDGSIAACQAPPGSTCTDPGALPLGVVAPEKLLIVGGTIRISAAPCYVDCPSYALNFSNSSPDPNVSGTAPTGPSGPGPAAKGQGKGHGYAKGQEKGQGGGNSGPQTGGSSGSAAGNELDPTNRVLYEFGEVMRPNVHSSDNAGCLFAVGACTVTIKY